MSIVDSIIAFLNTLTIIDFLFFFAVILLLVLIVSLVYFIKVNEDVLMPSRPKSELEIINEALLSETKKAESSFNSFEKEQEDKAIISYEELVKKNKNYDLNYTQEIDVDGIMVKKVDLENLTHETTNDIPMTTVRVISYKKEEEFLQTLKNLQNLLN